MADGTIGAPVAEEKDPATDVLIKELGEPKEHHEALLGALAVPVFDVMSYVDDFNSSIVGAYRRGIADLELPADSGVARSIIPPGTAAVRDFSTLAPRIPEFTKTHARRERTG